MIGRRDTNDFLLPAAITFLNDRDWLLRADFFHHMPVLARVTGPAGLHAFLMPCLEQVNAACGFRPWKLGLVCERQG